MGIKNDRSDFISSDNNYINYHDNSHVWWHVIIKIIFLPVILFFWSILVLKLILKFLYVVTDNLLSLLLSLFGLKFIEKGEYKVTISKKDLEGD